MNSDPCPQIRYWSQGIAADFLQHRDSVVSELTESLSDYDSMGDLLIWQNAFGLLARFKPFSFAELGKIRQATVKLLRYPLPDGREVYDHSEFRFAFEGFGNLCPEINKCLELYKLLAEVVEEDGDKVARYFTWIFQWGCVRELSGFVRFILDSGHPDAARALRLHLIQLETECKDGMDTNNVRKSLFFAGLESGPNFEELLNKLVIRDTEMYNIIQEFSDEQLSLAEADKKAIGDLEGYFESNPLFDDSD